MKRSKSLNLVEDGSRVSRVESSARMRAVLRVVFALPAVLVLAAVEACTRRTILACCDIPCPFQTDDCRVREVLERIRSDWSQADDLIGQGEVLPEAATPPANPDAEFLARMMSPPPYPSVPALAGEEVPDPFAEPLPRPLPMPSANQFLPGDALRPVEDLDEIGFDGHGLGADPYDAPEWNQPIDLVPADMLANRKPRYVFERIDPQAPADPMGMAVMLVASGVPVRRAARQAGVPESTLRNRVKKLKAAN